MAKFAYVMTSAGLAALLCAALPVSVSAEPAPVFDVDSFDSAGAEQSQDLPMPPAPGEEPATTHQAASEGSGVTPEGSTFVPLDNVAQEAPAQPKAGAVIAPGQQEVVEADDDHPVNAPGVSVSTEHLTPEQRMRRLEQQISNMQSNGGNAALVESLQAEVQSLRGQVEQLNHQLEKVKTQETVAKSDDDIAHPPGAMVAATATTVSKKSAPKKVQEEKPKEVVAAKAPANRDQPDVEEEQKAYQTAYDLIKAKKYPDAVETLQGMLKKYPSGQFASNAHYWLGELFGLMGKNNEALTEFSTVIDKFPGSPRVSDAQLKIGLIYAAQSKWSDAKKTFKKVINTYPGTASSRLASEQLKQIKLAGH